MSDRRVNDISDELKQIVKDAMPKAGQIIWFESVRPRSRGTTVLNTDRIYDPGYEDYVDIAYITGVEPSKGGAPPREILGRIQFTRAEFGRIGLRGGDRQHEVLFTYMFLTNQNSGNKDKPWFVPGRPAVFKQDEPKRRAGDRIAFDRQVRQAMDAIDIMEKTKLMEIAAGLDMDWVTQFTEESEIVSALYDIAKVNPSRVLGLDKDVTLKMKSDVKAAEKAGIIKRNDALQMWVWPETGEKICLYTPEKAPVDSMVAYLLGTGGKTYQFIVGMLEREREGKQQSKAIKNAADKKSADKNNEVDAQ